MALRNAVGRTAQRLGLGPVARAALKGARATSSGAQTAVRVAHDRARALDEKRRWWGYRRDVKFGVRLEVVSGRPRVNALPVVMCLWHRPSRMSEILDTLEAQNVGRPIRLVLWNNAPENDDHYRDVFAHRIFRNISSIELHSSGINMGGIGRFLAMRELTRTGYDGPFVMFDDDEVVSPYFLRDLLAAYRPGSITGWWAYRYDGTYYARRTLHHGEEANYIGTGGAACDSRLVRSRAFFDALPERYLFLEDMWMSAFARWNGWRLSKVDTPGDFAMREADQHHGIFDLKTDFSLYLNDAVPVRDDIVNHRVHARTAWTPIESDAQLDQERSSIVARYRDDYPKPLHEAPGTVVGPDDAS